MKDFPPRIVDGNGTTLSRDPNLLLLAFKKRVNVDKLAQILRSVRLTVEAGDKRLPFGRVNNSDRRLWVRSPRPIPAAVLDAVQQIGREFGLEWIAPAYRNPRLEGALGLLALVPNVLLVKDQPPRAAGTPAAAEQTLSRLLKGEPGRPALVEVVEKSRYLNGYRYLVISDPAAASAYEIREGLVRQSGLRPADIQFETTPYLVPTAVSPNDPLFAQQWNMTQIDAGGAGTTGWDISTGGPAAIICVLDEGCDLTHPDLQFADPGIRLDTMMPTGASTGNHGTPCAGIAAGRFNNSAGVAGVAGNSPVVPVAFVTWSDVEVAAGINWATAFGARVISMSFGYNAWSPAIIDPAIQNAFNNDVVMCVATHNYNGAITYPATNPLVIAVGASDQVDNRKTPASPDGETWWGSNFGPAMSVVAPGVLIPSTDRLGPDGYNTSAGAAGDYVMNFNGTSAATPHVAGLASLLRTAYPAMTNVEIRSLIERTAEKVGTVPYADTPGYPNGTWNQEMGYGRINVFRALDAADVMIKDSPLDTGAEPFTGGNFWDFSDIVVRTSDDNVFNPSNPWASRNVERGQNNYIYVQVTNNGLRPARNVTVSTRITPYVGLQFLYPADWTLVDSMHVSPAPITATFATIPAGGTAIAKFLISGAQTQTLWGWENSNPWHPCLLAVVTADNDYAFNPATLSGDQSPRRNNLAQRNLTVIDAVAGASATFPFVAGNLRSVERTASILIDRRGLPQELPMVLSLDEDGAAFPLLEREDRADSGEGVRMDDGDLVFLERTRLRTRLGACIGELTLEKGSRFECDKADLRRKTKVRGGDLAIRDGKRFVELREPLATVDMEVSPGRLYPMAVTVSMPATAKKGEEYRVSLAQQDRHGRAVGGATVIFVAR